jgi:class 3 adenylate cyclase/tetratricopeptide (TPR) repeat protein
VLGARRWLDEVARHTGQPGANEVDRALTTEDRQGTIGGPDALPSGPMDRRDGSGETTRPPYPPSHLADRILASRSALEGERKTVTALFCDIVDSTGTAERIGAEAMAALVEEFFTRSLAEVHRYEGTVTQFLGDGFLALFGAPLTQEDHAHRAVLAAWGVAATLRAHPILIPATERAVEVRMGLNSGEVVVGRIGDSLRMDYTAIGDTINLAARLQAAAGPGTIVLSESTYRAAERSIEVEPVGERLVKGRAEPVVVHRLVRVRDLGRPSGSPAGSRPRLVSRRPQVEQLERLIAHLKAGRGSLALVSGEAGVGKSRLVAEVRGRPDAAEARWLEGRTLSFGREIAYWPFLEALRGLCGILEDDGEPESLAKLDAQVRPLFTEDSPEVLPYLATLLGLEVTGELAERVRYLDGGAMGQQILLSVRRLFERLAREGPVVLVIEDLHWIDESSTQLVEHLLPLVREVPLLIVCVSRPDGGGPLERLRATCGGAHPVTLTEIALSPLTREESGELLEGLVGPGVVTAVEAERLLARAEGNPFFLEEIVRWRRAEGADAVALPETVEGVILARIDRLEEDVKEVLKVASVVGRSFLRRVLELVVAAGIALDAELDELLRIELIRERQRLPELEYLFTHALVQEATYGSILRQRRLELHRRVGECIERLFPDRLDEFYGLLAHHYGQAEDWPKAHEYLLKAAEEAARIAADAEALGYYRRALGTHAQVFGERWDPVERAALERGMGEAFFRLGRHEEATEHLYRALDLLGASYPQSRRGVGWASRREFARQLLGRPFVGRRRDRSSGPVDWERCGVYGALCWIDHQSDPERFGLDSLLLLNLAERRGITRGTVYGSAAVGLVVAHVPLDRVARGYRERSRALANELGDPLAMGDALLVASMGEHLRGHWGVALDGFVEAERLFREAGALRAWGSSATMRAYVLLYQSRFDECLAVCHEIERVARDASDPLLLGYALHTRAAVLLRRGHCAPALDLYLEAVELYRPVPAPFSSLRALADAALCHLRLGRLDEAVAAAEESEAIVVRHRFRGFQPVNAAIAAADVFLQLAEEGSEEALGKASTAVRTAAKRTKVAVEGKPGAHRVRGNIEWLRGREGAARRWWRRSLEEAESQGAPYEAALTALDAGRRLGDPEHLARAAARFEELGSTWYADRAREALSEAPKAT